MTSKITVELSEEEALVLFDWLARFNKRAVTQSFGDQSEQRVLWNLEAALEQKLVAPFDPNYFALLKAARDALRD